ncbi:MAG: YbaN family protein [Paludibacteraceae bacterium]
MRLIWEAYGIFVPLLPTTPFLLLSAALYAKSSEKLYHRLLNHRVLGGYIRSFREEKAISLKVKIVAISTMWITMGYCIFFIVNNKWYVQLILAVIALAVTIHILSYKTKSR